MMKELKRNLKLMKYGYSVKTNIICMVIVLLCGSVELLIPSADSWVLGSYFLTMAPVFLMQLIIFMLPCGIVGSSPNRRFIETKMMDIVQFVIAMGSYLLSLSIALVQIHNQPESEAAYAKAILAAGFLTPLLIIYFTTSYKMMFVSTVLFVISITAAFNGFRIAERFMGMTFSFKLNTAIVMGFLFVLAGLVLSAVLRRLLYKKSISKAAMGWQLRKSI